MNGAVRQLTTPYGPGHCVETGVRPLATITVCNADRCLEANDPGRNSYNGLNAKTNDKGAFTIFSGGCDDWRVNDIPITPDW